MSKKHFEAVAAELRARLEVASQGEGSLQAAAAVECVIRGLANVFADFNPRFDQARFLRACGL